MTTHEFFYHVLLGFVIGGGGVGFILIRAARSTVEGWIRDTFDEMLTNSPAHQEVLEAQKEIGMKLNTLNAGIQHLGDEQVRIDERIALTLDRVVDRLDKMQDTQAVQGAAIASSATATEMLITQVQQLARHMNSFNTT